MGYIQDKFNQLLGIGAIGMATVGKEVGQHKIEQNFTFFCFSRAQYAPQLRYAKNIADFHLPNRARCGIII